MFNTIFPDLPNCLIVLLIYHLINTDEIKIFEFYDLKETLGNSIKIPTNPSLDVQEFILPPLVGVEASQYEDFSSEAWY